MRNETSSRLRRIGSACAAHPLPTVAVWLVLVVGTLVGSHAAGGSYSDNVNLSGTQADTGLTLLQRHDRAVSGYSGIVVLHVAHGTLASDKDTVASVTRSLASIPHVVSATDPFSTNPPTVSADQRTAYVDVHLDASPKSLGSSFLHQLERATSPLVQAGVEVEYGGDFDQLTRPGTSDGRSELIGFGVALVVLLIGFGSVAAAVLPLLSALVAVLVGLSTLGIVAVFASFGTAAPTLALMIGLGVGIDYAVFLTTRFRQLLIDGADSIDAAGTTVETSGRAVLIAASTVSVALLGLYASGIVFIGQLGLAAVFGVLAAGAGGVTLVPAGLGLLGRRIDRLSVRRPVAETGKEGDAWHRYAALIGRHAWSFLALGVVILGTLAIPLFSIRLGHVGDGADPTSFTDKRAYDLVASGFGPGQNGPFTIVVDVSHAEQAASGLSSSVLSALKATPGVAEVSSMTQTSDHALLVGSVVPSSGPQDAATTTLYNRLVDTTLPDSLQGSDATGYVTGSTASQIEFTAILERRLLVVIAIVVAIAFLLVMTAFRSLLLAVKAALCNLLSIGAAYGVIVAVFQWGWGRGLLGVSENVPIESYVPVVMFAIVFGLSMDYEIFLLARVKETWDATHDHARSVALGLSATGRVISCAALIMTSVFAAFVGSDVIVVKMLAIGLAASVVLDATVVRLLLVPAIMYVLGEASWWLPAPLDRRLPRIEIEPAPVPVPSAMPPSRSTRSLR